MKHFYSVPTALLATTKPGGAWHATSTPGTPSVSLVIVEHWYDHASQDAWEALPGVNEHFPENMGQPAPAGVITAIAPWGATTGMTLRQVFQLIRQNWSGWRP